MSVADALIQCSHPPHCHCKSLTVTVYQSYSLQFNVLLSSARSWHYTSHSGIKTTKVLLTMDQYISTMCQQYYIISRLVMFMDYFLTSSAVTTCEISALYHEVFDDSVKLAAFVRQRISGFIILHNSSNHIH